MDSHPVVIDRSNDDIEAKQRFESFKLGKGLPSTANGHRPSHSRSHSRNMSISSLSSLSVLSHKVSPPPSEDAGGSPPGQALVPSTRRNSHHRRRSSVSTRHESAEMMGVSIPDLPVSEDNVNFGDKDSVRRRALWALEGKANVSYSKVEIPELSSPHVEKLTSDLPNKSSFPPSLSNHLTSKRDSFKLLSSASSTKDQLHTLMEEDEEEEDGASSVAKRVSAVTDPFSVPVLQCNKRQTAPHHVAVRPRPASLTLRPLSLTPERLSISSNQPPVSTPRSGLKTLSLSLTVNSEETTALSSGREQRRRSFNFPNSGPLNNDSVSSNEEHKIKRRSSISYKSSSTVTINHAGLPTPEMTPNYKERHFSLADSVKESSEDEFFLQNPSRSRPLSASEQHFLLKSHNALLARITDLERALSTKVSSDSQYPRDSTRPTSLASELSFASDQTVGEPSDEMLQLLADLKAERDEYKRDVDAWRCRVNEMENRLATMAKRVEAERRDAWIARSKMSLIEVEKSSLEKQLENHEATLTALKNEKKALELENQRLQDGIAQAHADLFGVKEQLKQTQREIEGRMRSNSFRPPLTPDSSDDGDALVGCEESDTSFRTSSSYSSEGTSESALVFSTVEEGMSQTSPSTPDTVKIHASRHSLSKTWTFPTRAQMVAGPHDSESDVDKFFGCLEDGDNETSPTLSDLPEYNYERSKGLFSAALKACKDDEESHLAFPGLGIVAEAVDVFSAGTLPAVVEEGEAEDLSVTNTDEEMFGEAGGICITLTPAQEEADEEEEEGHGHDDRSITFQTLTSEPPVLPPLTFDSFERETEGAAKSVSIDFSRYDISEPFASNSRTATIKAASTNSFSPSSIPRLKTYHKNNSSSSTGHIPPYAYEVHSTPPKRQFPSLIPQAITSPSPIRIVHPYPRPRFSLLSSTRPTQSKQQSSILANPTQHLPNVKNEKHIAQDCRSSISESTDFMPSTEQHATTIYTTGDGPTPDPAFDDHQILLSPPKFFNTSSRLSLQALTNVIPSSWMRRILTTHKPLAESPTSIKPCLARRTPKFVSKEVQLEKLRSRLQSEGLAKITIPLRMHCKKCVSDPVQL